MQRIKMYLNEKDMERHARNNPEPPAYAFFQDEYEHRQFELFHEDWVEMGSPKVITVKVEPGDKLNKPLRRGIDFLTPNQIRDGLR